MFPEAKRAMSKSELERLGEEILRMKEQMS